MLAKKNRDYLRKIKELLIKKFVMKIIIGGSSRERLRENYNGKISENFLFGRRLTKIFAGKSHFRLYRKYMSTSLVYIEYFLYCYIL